METIFKRLKMYVLTYITADVSVSGGSCLLGNALDSSIAIGTKVGRKNNFNKLYNVFSDYVLAH